MFSTIHFRPEWLCTLETTAVEIIYTTRVVVSPHFCFAQTGARLLLVVWERKTRSLLLQQASGNEKIVQSVFKSNIVVHSKRLLQPQRARSRQFCFRYYCIWQFDDQDIAQRQTILISKIQGFQKFHFVFLLLQVSCSEPFL